MKNLLLILTIALFSCGKQAIEQTEKVKLQLVKDEPRPPEFKQFLIDRANYEGAKLEMARKNPKPCGGRRNPCPPEPPTNPPTNPPTTPAAALLQIDFDGNQEIHPEWYQQHWSGQSFWANGVNMPAEDLLFIENQVRTNMAGINIRVTTSQEEFDAFQGPKTKAVVTSDNVFGTHSGLAFNGSMFYGLRTCYIFAQSLYYLPSYIAEIVTHETGHTATHNHQSTYNADGTLYSRYTEGAHMGVSWSQPGKWIYGTSTSPNTFQDDYGIWYEKVGRA